jgi:hypothetical protein
MRPVSTSTNAALFAARRRGLRFTDPTNNFTGLIDETELFRNRALSTPRSREIQCWRYGANCAIPTPTPRLRHDYSDTRRRTQRRHLHYTEHRHLHRRQRLRLLHTDTATPTPNADKPR